MADARVGEVPRWCGDAGHRIDDVSDCDGHIVRVVSARNQHQARGQERGGVGERLAGGCGADERLFGNSGGLGGVLVEGRVGEGL